MFNALTEADNLYKQARRNNMLDRGIVENSKSQIFRTKMVVVDPKDVNVVKLRLEESDKQLQVIDIDKKYHLAIDEGRSYYSQKKYEEAIKAYEVALGYKPGDGRGIEKYSYNRLCLG